MTSAQTCAALAAGATSVNKTYTDWAVLCSVTDKGRACLMTQQQRQKDTDQLVLAVEQASAVADQLRGNLVLPFGLRIADGVTLKATPQHMIAEWRSPQSGAIPVCAASAAAGRGGR